MINRSTIDSCSTFY